MFAIYICKIYFVCSSCSLACSSSFVRCCILKYFIISLEWSCDTKVWMLCVIGINYILNLKLFKVSRQKHTSVHFLWRREPFTHTIAQTAHTCSFIVVTFICRSLERQTKSLCLCFSQFYFHVDAHKKICHNDECENP